jgi:hypothetical protein
LGASASASTSTYCPRQWAVQVRRSARPATSAQRIGPSVTGFRSYRGRWGQETTDRTHSTGTIAFSPFRQALLPQGTALTIGLVGEVDGALS